MAIFVYSHESIPNQKLMGKASYTPEWLQYAGVTLPPLNAGEWQELSESYYWRYKRDWTNKAGSREHVEGSSVMGVLSKRFEARGVIFLDHEPTKNEREVYALKSKSANDAFRMSCIEFYENQVREKEVTGHGRTQPTAYEDECYSILGLTKPYSVEAMRAQRHPGEAVGAQIVAALEMLDKRRAAEAADGATKSNKPAH